MRVLVVSWEYPPVLVGGLGRHVHALATGLAAAGHEVVVLSRRAAGTDAVSHPTSDTVVDGVRVLAVAEDPAHLTFEQDLLGWTLAMGHAMLRAALTRLAGWRPDVVHAHDWLVAHPAIALADASACRWWRRCTPPRPGGATAGCPARLSRQVHSCEWWLANRADTVITCSAAMRAEVAELFDLDPAAIPVLPNGIAPRRWRVPAAAVAAARARHAPDGEPLLVHFGRLEYQKGGQDLIAALPRIRRAPSRRPAAGRRHRVGRGPAGGPGPRAPGAAQRALPRPRPGSSSWPPCSPRPTRSCCPAATSRSASSRWRRRPPARRWSRRRRVGWARWCGTARPGCRSRPATWPAWPAAVGRVLDDPDAARRRARAARARLATDFDWARIAAATAAVYAGARPGGPVELGRPKIPTGNAFGRPAR